MIKALQKSIVILMGLLICVQGYGVYAFDQIVPPSAGLTYSTSPQDDKQSSQEESGDSDTIPIPFSFPDEETKEDCEDIDDLKVNDSFFNGSLERFSLIKPNTGPCRENYSVTDSTIPTPPPDNCPKV